MNKITDGREKDSERTGRVKLGKLQSYLIGRNKLNFEFERGLTSSERFKSRERKKTAVRVVPDEVNLIFIR